MSRQVDSPGQRGGTHQHLDQSLREQPLHQVAVRSQHASMVDAEAITEEVSQLLVTGLGYLDVEGWGEGRRRARRGKRRREEVGREEGRGEEEGRRETKVGRGRRSKRGEESKGRRMTRGRMSLEEGGEKGRRDEGTREGKGIRGEKREGG